MIGVKNQWAAQINGDEIESDEFRMLVLEEKADLSLPTVHFQFQTKDPEKMERFNTPGYKVKIGLGKEDASKIVANFRVFKKKIVTFQGNDNWALDLWLILDHLPYYNEHRMETYNTWSDLKKSSEVVSTVCSRVGLTPKVFSSDDKMLWIQPNVPDRRFLEDVTQHGWFGEDKPVAFGINRKGEMLYKPVKELLTTKFKIGNMKDAELNVDEYGITTSDGLFSSWVGKTRNAPTNLHEEGVYINKDIDSRYDSEVEPQISNEIGLYEDEKFAPIAWQNDNVHYYWNKAEAQNLQFRASIASQTMEVSQHGGYRDVYVLDCLTGTWERIVGGKPVSIPEINGKWLVSGLRHFMYANQYRIDLFLSRERMIKMGG